MNNLSFFYQYDGILRSVKEGEEIMFIVISENKKIK